MIYELTIITPENNTAEDMAKIKKIIEKWGVIYIIEDDGVKWLVYLIGIGNMSYNYGYFMFYIVELNEGDF